MFFQVASNVNDTAPHQVAASYVLCTLLLYMCCCCCIFCFTMLVFALSIFNSECRDTKCEDYFKGISDLDSRGQSDVLHC